MSITVGSLVRVSLFMSLQNQTLMNVWDYEVGGVATTIGAGDLAQAWWNHVKTAYRGLAQAYLTNAFEKVLVSELENVAGAYGEYAIPVEERAGLRANIASGEHLPTFNAAGVRLAVGSRATRPGQKRLPFLHEGDNQEGLLSANFTGIVVALMGVTSVSMTLGAPAIATVLQPIVVGLEASGAVREWQNVTGYAVNPYVTSQVSRKIGRGT